MSSISRAKSLLSEFGLKVTFAKIFQSAVRRIPGLRTFAGMLKYKAITKFLYKENKDIIINFNKEGCEVMGTIGAESPVWMLWWQGFDMAPQIVKMCVESVKLHIGNRPLILLSEDNYEDYVQIPQHYKDLFNNGQISRTFFSDILRLNLLYQRGGVWLDATYLLTDKLPVEISNMPFFTIRHGMNKEYPMSKGLWTGSAIASIKNNSSIGLFLEIFNRYFNKHKVLIDYLLIDYIFAVCCDNCVVVEKMFTSVPENNNKVNNLLSIMNDEFDEKKMRTILDGTTMHKLSWKFEFRDKIDDKETVYGHFYKKYIKN